MENEEKQMTGEESLRIITEMINKTKMNISQGSFHLLFWGWLVFVCSLTDYLAGSLTTYSHPYYVWFLVIPGVFVSLIYGFVKGRKASVHTYADKLYLWIWMGFLISALVLFTLMSDKLWLVGPFILLLAGYATFASGIILKFKPLIIGGITFWIFALIARFAGGVIEHLALPAAMLTGYLIPGYLLRRRKGHDTV
jgi:hypothetical protein